MIAVFISNKLVSADTILPLLFELARRHKGCEICFYTSHRPTYDAILRNRVLHDGISEIGSIRFIGASGRSLWARFVARFLFLLRIVGFFALALRGKLTVIHFGVLNRWPFRLLYLINRRRTFYFQQVAVGHSATESRIDNLVAQRRDAAGSLAAHTVVAFQESWHPPVDGEPAVRLTHGPTQNLRHWMLFVERRSASYFAEEFAAAGLCDADEVLVFMLGYFGKLPFLARENSMAALLHETIAALLEAGGGRPILIKPHVITDEAFLRRELSRYAGAPVLVTNLHPAVLARRARLFIANYYSTTLYTGRLLGVPTIEYTDYNEAALAVTDGGSMRPEAVTHFVNRDQAALRRAISLCIDAPIQRSGTAEADDVLLDCLAGRLDAAA